MPSLPDKDLIKSTIRERVKGERRYNPHGTHRMEELAGVKLASFKHRFWAYMADLFILYIIISILTVGFFFTIHRFFNAGQKALDLAGVHIDYNNDKNTPAPANTDTAKNTSSDDSDDNEIVTSKGPAKIHVNTEKAEAIKEASEFTKLLFSILYFGLSLWATNGRTIGKKWMGIRVISLSSQRLTLWQACERTLGYGASALELGFGYFQFFINPNRCCVHDRIAETIVIEDPPREPKAAKSEAEIVKQVAKLEAEEARAVDDEVLNELENKPPTIE